MPKSNVSVQTFNRGEVSPLALARVEVDRVRLSAETMINWVPKTLGPMTIRPGLGYLGATASNNAAQVIPFIAGTTDTAILEITNALMRVWVNDALVTRASVSTSISNGSFATSANWTDASTGGASLSFGASGLGLDPNAAGGIAMCTREITVAGGDQNVEHGLKIVIPTGLDPVIFRCGSTSGGDEYISETRLLAGQHHLTFTPTGNFHLTFMAISRYGVTRRVTSIAVEAAGVMSIVAPWATADLDNIQWAQSADVVFVTCDGVKPYRIERRSTTGWSVVEYKCDDGPFIGQTADLQIKANDTIGRPTLTASRNFFKSEHVGALFRLFHEGQRFENKVSDDNQYSDAIRVAGVTGTNYNERAFTFQIAGTWAGTLSTQRSIDGPESGFADYPRDASAATTVDITGNATYSNEDEDDNLIAWYRMGFNDGDYTSGTARIIVTYPGGGDYGIVRITAVTNGTTATAEVIRPLRGQTYTENWSEGAFSEQQYWPASIVLHEGRLWFFGGAQIFGSASDDYESFNQEEIGDAGPIIRTIGEGPVDRVNWALSLGRLIISTDGGEFALKASSIDEPMTPSNFVIKPLSSQGSKGLFPAVKVDERGIFIQRSGKRVMEIAPAGDTPSGYRTSDLTVLHPDVAAAGVVSMAVQRQPDTRIHLVLADGTALILTYDQAEDVIAWSRVETGTDGAPGVIERVVVLSDDDEDGVYYVVKRTINGSVVRYLEKWAVESEIDGDDLCKLADSFGVYDSTATTTPSGFSHLNGENVIVWADGNVIEESDGAGGYRPKEHAVSGGTITLTTAASKVVAGLAYTADYKSTKLAYAAGGGSALNQKKRVNKLGLVLGTTHHRGLQFGRSFTQLDPLPYTYQGTTIADGTIYDAFDAPQVTFPGSWDTDSRFCIRGQAPYPATVLAAVIEVETSG